MNSGEILSKIQSKNVNATLVVIIDQSFHAKRKERTWINQRDEMRPKEKQSGIKITHKKCLSVLAPFEL